MRETMRIPAIRSRIATLAAAALTVPALVATALIAWALAPGVARAENVLKLGYGEGQPGDTGVEVMITAVNDTPIHGYSIAFTFPADVLVLRTMSTNGTQVQSIEPDFVAPRVDNQIGVANLGVIFAFTEPITLKELPPIPAGSYPRIVARLIFDIRADAAGGEYKLEFVDGLGQPAGFNRFSDAGTSIVPRLEDGSFRVSGGDALTLEKKIAFPGIEQNVTVQALIRHTEPLGGFQVGFTYDKAAMKLTSGTFAGTSLGIELGSSLIEAFKFDNDENYSATLGRATTAALFDFAPPFQGQTLSPSTASPPSQSIMKYTFKVAAAAVDTAEFYDLVLADTSIPGAIDNRFIVDDRSLDPTLIHGKIYFSLGFLRGRVVDSVSGTPIAGAKVTTSPDGYVASTDVNGRFFIEGADKSGIPPGAYELIVSRSGYYTNRQKGLAAGGPIVVTGAGNTTEVGDVPLYKIPPAVSTDKFLRGFINNDNKTDLSDSIFLLQYLFRGGEAPGCLLAADINDDNKVDISDTIYMLNHLFLGGPAPPPPYSFVGIGCAVDPTPGGDLSCFQTICP